VSTIMDDVQMPELTAVEQAKRAIGHALEQIRTRDEVGYLLGPGTQTFSLLTEAAATLSGKPVRETREICLPRNPKYEPPKTDGSITESAVIEFMRHLDSTGRFEIVEELKLHFPGAFESDRSEDVVEFLQAQSYGKRLQQLAIIAERFCTRCGGYCAIPEFCGCTVASKPSVFPLAATAAPVAV
jgi:hypothetical protein